VTATCHLKSFKGVCWAMQDVLEPKWIL
jgi:hypothetical protein